MTLLTALTPPPVRRWIDRMAIQKFRDNPDFDPKKNHLFFRCQSCRRILTAKDTVTIFCPCGEGTRVKPANLTSREQLHMIWRLFWG